MFVTPDVWEFLAWADRAEEFHLWPEGPVGTANTMAFLDGLEFAALLKAKTKLELKANG